MGLSPNVRSSRKIADYGLERQTSLRMEYLLQMKSRYISRLPM